RGERPDPGEYRARFPGQESAIEAAFRAAEKPTPGTAPAERPVPSGPPEPGDEPSHPALLREFLAMEPEARRPAGAHPTPPPPPRSPPPAAPPPARPRGLPLRCPHCGTPIEVVDPPPADEVVCPSCGSTFPVASGGPPPGTVAPEPGARRFGRFEL